MPDKESSLDKPLLDSSDCISNCLKNPYIIYIPTYNCRKTIANVLSTIPAEFQGKSDVLVVDNQSSDGTPDFVMEQVGRNVFELPVHLVQPINNQGYAGSQKLAYQLALKSPNVEWVIMLHGDGQYNPKLLSSMHSFLRKPFQVVYGYRTKRFGAIEETPRLSYMAIKILSFIESVATGIHRLEWHSGFVAYHRSFLELVDFQALTSTMHIDGQMHFLSGMLRCRVVALPIYKRYEGLEGLGGLRCVRHVCSVVRLLGQFCLEKHGFKPISGLKAILSPCNEYKTQLHEIAPFPSNIDTDEVF